MGKTADLTVVQKTIIDTLHKEGSHKHSLQKKLAVHRVLYPSMLTESWVEGKSVEEKDAQPTERTAALWGLSSKMIQEFGWTLQGMNWGWVQGIKSTTHRRVEEFGYSCRQRRLTWTKEKKNWTVAQWSKALFSGRASSLRPSGSLTQTLFHKLSQDSLLSVKKNNKNIHIPYCRYVCIPSTTRCTSLSSLLFILIFIKSHILFLHILFVFAHLTVLLFCTFLYSIAHFTFYIFLPNIYILLCGVTFI